MLYKFAGVLSVWVRVVKIISRSPVGPAKTKPSSNLPENTVMLLVPSVSMIVTRSFLIITK